jgi:hypothetical protein
VGSRECRRCALCRAQGWRDDAELCTDPRRVKGRREKKKEVQETEADLVRIKGRRVKKNK